MENRKFVIFTAPILLLGFFILSAQNVLAYGVETHAFLTDAVVDFYNQHYPNKQIDEELRSFLIDGARREDNMPRYMNHFYDPVNDRGLADGVYRGHRSKEWAQNNKLQNSFIYKITPSTVATILTASQLEKIKPIFKKTDFTWQRAVKLYAEGKTEQALFALGHIIHLIEDASVPDHTRNDAHPPWDHGGSPYENWIDRFELNTPDENLAERLKNGKPIEFDSLGLYFDSMAGYSNNNFYSRDSIKNYELPQPDYFKVENHLNYGFKKDLEFGDYKLAIFAPEVRKFEWKRISEEIIGISDDKNDFVLQDYWDRLSAKTVQHGAGVIDLFFKEAEAAKAKYELDKARKPLLGRLIDGFGAVFGGGSTEESVDGFSKVTEIPLSGEEENDEDENFGASVIESINRTDRTDETNKPDESGMLDDTNKIVGLDMDDTTDKIDTTDTIDKTEQIPTEIVAMPLCGFNTDKTPTHQNAIINEVAWMGTVANANDEWIELKNISGNELDISGWQLIDKGEQIKITFESGTKIPAQGFLLLERTDDTSVPNITADVIYSGALSNYNEGLRLFDNNCGLLDEVFANSDWPGGSFDRTRTLERSGDLSWHTSSVDGGTAKAENSAPAQPFFGGGGSSAPIQNNTPVAEPEPTPEPAPASEPEVAGPEVLISEVQAGTTANGATDEFVELYNPTDQTVDLTGWSLKKKTSSGNESNLVSSGAFSGSIAPRSFFLIAHANYKGTKTPDLTYSANSNNLAYTNNSAALYDASGNVVDEATWAEIPKDQSWERKALVSDACVSATGNNELLGNGCDTDNDADFEIREVPKPQNATDPPEPRTSASIENFSITYSPENLELSFTWDSISGVNEYSIFETSGDDAELVATTTDNSFSLSIKEINRDYSFSLNGKDADGFNYESEEVSLTIPGFFTSINLYNSAIDLEWSEYPFAPNLFGEDSEKNWHTIIFYKNRAPEEVLSFGERATLWGVRSVSDTLRLNFIDCLNRKAQDMPVLILSDDDTSCGDTSEVARSLALKWNNEDGLRSMFNLFKDITEDDYITIAFYDHDPSMPDSPQRLIAIDKNQYISQGEAPANQSPTAPENIKAEYYPNSKEILLSWNPSSDPDGPDRAISYELNYQGEAWRKNIPDPTWTIRGAYLGDTFTFNLRAVDAEGNYSEISTLEYSVPLPEYLSNVNFSNDDGGNYVSFDLNDTNTFNNEAYSRYIMVWFNEDPAEMTVPNRSSGLYGNWAGICPGTGFVGEGEKENNSGTGFDHYVMPEFNVAEPLPPVYDSGPYHYKIYLTSECPNSGFANGIDMTATMTPQDFITVGLWFYNTPNDTINKDESVNYPERIHFAK